MAKSKRVSLRGDFFQTKGDERPIVIVTAGPLARDADVCFAPLIFARRVGGIDSIAEGHWTIDFRRSI